MKKINLLIVIVLLIVILVFILKSQPTTKNFNVTESIVVLTEGQKEGPLLVLNIYFDHITGLNFVEYPVPSEQGVPITLYIGEQASNGCNVILTLIKIQDKTAVFKKEVLERAACPICLSGDTFIDTPSGPINIKDLKEGMAVWTADLSGLRYPAIILKTVIAQVPKSHAMVHLILDDGREIYVSPGHTLADDRILADISVGDIVDNGQVIIAELVPYKGKATYDILPSGDTGLYWANKILVKSTIATSK